MSCGSRARFFVFGLVSVVAVGCAKDDEPAGSTDEFKINELSASFGVGIDASTLTVRAALLKGGFLRVGDGDKVTIDVGGKEVSTYERVDGGRVHTIAEVKPPPAGRTEIVVTFTRGDERVVAKTLIAPPFELVDAPTSAKRGEAVKIDLSPRPDLEPWKGPLGPSLRHGVIVRGECVEKGEQKVEGCGADSPAGQCTQGYPFTFDTSKLKLTTESDCDVDVEVQLQTNGGPFVGEGPAKEAFSGGAFNAVQHRAFKLRLAR